PRHVRHHAARGPAHPRVMREAYTAEIDPRRWITRLRASGITAGPWMTAPVDASNSEPWHGQTSMPEAYSTRHPAWVHTALNAASDPSRWRTTMSGEPSPGSR